MTVSSTLTSRQYTGTGTSAQFSFPNKIFSAGDLVITVYDTSGNTYPFVNFGNAVLGWTYSVQNVDVDTGSIVVLSQVLTNGWVLDIRSLIPELQSTSVKNQGQFLPELHEEAFDRLTREIQDLLRLTYTFGIHGPDTEFTSWPALPVASVRRGYALMFDAVSGLPGIGFLSAQNVTIGLLAPFLNLQQTNAENAAGVTPTNFGYQPGDIRRYGAVPSVDSTAALQAAVNQAIHGGTAVYIPAGSWPISSTITIASGFGITVRGDNFGSSILLNNIVGNPANPLFLITTQNDYFLFADFEVQGNNTPGAGGNGNAFSIINPSFPSSLFPAYVVFSRVNVTSHIGNGKNSGGGSIPACAWYAFGVTVIGFDNCAAFNNCNGGRTEQCQKVHYSQCTIDGNVPGAPGINCLYIDSCENVVFDNGTLNSAGAGNSTDGCVFVAGTAASSLGFVLANSRAKGGLPAVVNLNGSAFCTNRNIVIEDNELEQFTDPGSHAATMIAVGNGNVGVKISGNYISFSNTFTAAVGIDVTQTTAGINCGGLVIEDNVFDIGSGGTYLACVRLNVTSDRVVSPRISANVCGPNTGAFTITDGVRLFGNIDNAVVEQNHFRAGSTGVITNAINLQNAQVRWPRLEGNTYDTSGGGTITNQITNGSALGVYRNEDGIFAPGDASSAIAPISNGTIPITTPLIRCAPAGNLTGLILTAGLFRGQEVTLANGSAFTMTFAASGSNVADGSTSAIPANCARKFTWDANAALWFRAA